MFHIKATDGDSYIHRPGKNEGEDSKIWSEKAAAEARAEKANDKAAELGIKTRYEVVEA